MRSKKAFIGENSVVQVNELWPKEFLGCFAIVTAVKDWGVEAQAPIPNVGGRFRVSFEWEQIEFIGQAILRLKEIG